MDHRSAFCQGLKLELHLFRFPDHDLSCIYHNIGGNSGGIGGWLRVIRARRGGIHATITPNILRNTVNSVRVTALRQKEK